MNTIDRLERFFQRLPRPGLTQILLGVLILLQFPLWFGQGGWIRVWRLERQVEAKQLENETKRLRIAELEGEVRDFKSSPRAAEERARYELGMIMPGERFVQWGEPAAPNAAPTAGSADPQSRKGGRP